MSRANQPTNSRIWVAGQRRWLRVISLAEFFAVLEERGL
jgi:hypothetical protein